MSTYEPEGFEPSVAKLAALIIVGAYALQLGFAGLYLVLLDRYGHISAPPAPMEIRRPPAPLADAQICGLAEIDISDCDAVVTVAMDDSQATYCRPPGDSRSAGSIVRRYLVEHPDEISVAFDQVVDTALTQAWPCRVEQRPVQ